MSQQPQTYANHARWHPFFHFLLLPLSAILIIISIVQVVKEPELEEIWQLLISIGFFLAIGAMRGYATKTQDRIIRLEERLRLERLLSGALKARIPELTESQLIGIRFASDGEVPEMVEKALAGADLKTIKQAIKNWRPDYFRV